MKYQVMNCRYQSNNSVAILYATNDKLEAIEVLDYRNCSLNYICEKSSKHYDLFLQDKKKSPVSPENQTLSPMCVGWEFHFSLIYAKKRENIRKFFRKDYLSYILWSAGRAVWLPVGAGLRAFWAFDWAVIIRLCRAKEQHWLVRLAVGHPAEWVWQHFKMLCRNLYSFPVHRSAKPR